MIYHRMIPASAGEFACTLLEVSNTINMCKNITRNPLRGIDSQNITAVKSWD
jgi:hypothetical protein